MKKIIIVLGAIVSVFIMTSVVTAVPHINSKTIKENNILLSDFEEKAEKIKEKNVVSNDIKEKIEKTKGKNVLFNNIKEYVGKYNKENFYRRSLGANLSYNRDVVCILFISCYNYLCIYYCRNLCSTL